VAAKGGGLYDRKTIITLNDSASITGNAADVGGGIFNRGGSVTLNDASVITGNTPDDCHYC